MKRDVQKISLDIASSKLFAPSGSDAVTGSDTAQPTATNAPADAPTAAGSRQSAQATSTKGQKKAKRHNGSTPAELEGGSTVDNTTAIPQEVNSRPAHQARVYALIGQCWPVSITDKDLKRSFNQSSNRIACQISAEYAAKDREIERLRRAGLRQTNTADASRARPDRPLTRSELIGIITEALRDDQVKGAEVSSLTKTIRELVPELFTEQSDGVIDPAAYLEHITRFAGLSGAEIVQQAGGIDWMQQRLSEMLKSDVRIMPLT